jgi:hypothetical protein
MKHKIEYIESLTDGHDFLVDRPLRDILKQHFSGRVNHTITPKVSRDGTSTRDIFNLFNTNEVEAKEEMEKFVEAQAVVDTKNAVSLGWRN